VLLKNAKQEVAGQVSDEARGVAQGDGLSRAKFEEEDHNGDDEASSVNPCEVSEAE